MAGGQKTGRTSKRANFYKNSTMLFFSNFLPRTLIFSIFLTDVLNASDINVYPDDYPQDKDDFTDCSQDYSLVQYVDAPLTNQYRKLPLSPRFARNNNRVLKDREYFETLFASFFATSDRIENKKWIMLSHGYELLNLQTKGYKWDNPLMFYAFNALFNGTIFSNLNPDNDRIYYHIPSPIIVLIGSSKSEKVILDWKIVTPFYVHPEGLEISGGYSEVINGPLWYICDCLFPSLYIESRSNIDSAISDIWLWRLGIDAIFLSDRSIEIEAAYKLLINNFD